MKTLFLDVAAAGAAVGAAAGVAAAASAATVCNYYVTRW